MYAYFEIINYYEEEETSRCVLLVDFFALTDWSFSHSTESITQQAYPLTRENLVKTTTRAKEVAKELARRAEETRRAQEKQQSAGKN